MNKETFLKELREYLKILEDQEQEDILAEYAQHIDMKMQKGLSEEEAIKDFGSMQELAAEILEAYHVKPEFNREGKRHAFYAEAKQSTDNGATKAVSAMKGWINRIKEKLLQGFRAIGRGFITFGRWLMKPVERKEGCCDSKEEFAADIQQKSRQTKEVKGKMRGFLKASGQGIAEVWRGFISLCIWCIRFCWNAAWVMFGLLCAFFCMAALMGAGALIILIFQGYPLAGILLICIGGILCMGALTGGAFSLLIRKKKDTADEVKAITGKAFEGEVNQA